MTADVRRRYVTSSSTVQGGEITAKPYLLRPQPSIQPNSAVYYPQDIFHEACNFVNSKKSFTFATLLHHCHHGAILSHGDLWVFSFAVKAEEQEQLPKHLIIYDKFWLIVCVVRGIWIHTEKKKHSCVQGTGSECVNHAYMLGKVN